MAELPPNIASLTTVKPSPRLADGFLRIDQFLGHGRALETYLAVAKTLFGLSIAVPQQLDHAFVIFQDLLWWYPNWYIGLPFMILGMAQFSGIYLHYCGRRFGTSLRAVCAVLAEFAWAVVLVRHIQVAEFTGILPFALASFFANVWIFWKATNGLPPPASSGLVA